MYLVLTGGVKIIKTFQGISINKRIKEQIKGIGMLLFTLYIQWTWTIVLELPLPKGIQSVSSSYHFVLVFASC